MVYLVPSLVILGGMLIVIGVALPFFAHDVVSTRLAQFAERPRTLEEMELSAPFSERVLRPLLHRLAGLVNRFSRRKDPRQQERHASSVQQRLNLAGNPNRWTPTDFLGVKALVAIIVGAIGFLILTIVGMPAFAVIAAAAGLVIGFFLPELYLNQVIKGRQHAIQRALPDCLDLLSICVEAGLGFDAAMGRMVSKSDNQLTREFGRALQELRVGRPRREALREVVARTEVPDLANFISAVIQADQLGVSITQVLGVQADQMRTVRRQRAEEQAAQAPLKMLIPMLLFIFPALCVVILGPLWPQLANVSTTAP